MNVKITRRSTVGFGYNTGASQVWNKSYTHSHLVVDPTERPIHTGTILKVFDAIESDRNYRSLQGGTYYTTAWFVKVDGAWRKIKNTDENLYEFNLLTEENDRDYREWSGRKYARDEVTVEVE